MKKTLALALACVLALSVVLVGCGGGSTPGSNGTNGTSGGNTASEKQLAVQLGPNPETIDPALNNTIDGATMLLHAFETLLTIDENNNIQPGQAETWEVSEDGLTWTFHLRQGLKWSDGTDLTADDFVYSWQRMANPATAAPYAETAVGMIKGYAEAIENDGTALAVSAPDASTFVVELANPCTYFEKIAAFISLSPVNKASVEANGDAWAVEPSTYVSNGPFRMREWTVGSNITFEKNPNYWNADAVKLDSLKFVLMEDPTAAYTAYQNGEVLLAKDVPTEEIPSLSRVEDGGDFYVAPIMGTYYLSLNLTREHLQDVRVRKALSLAIDREYVANVLMQGTYSPAYNLVGPGITDADSTTLFMDKANGGKSYIEQGNYEANLALAKELLAEAGYPEGKGFPAIEYVLNDSGYHKPLAEYLQQVWGDLGLTVNVNVVEWSSFTPQRRAGDFDIARNGWSFDYNDPSSMLELFMTSNGNNDGKFSNAEYDAAMELARSSGDLEARFAALHTAEDIIMNEMGMLPIAYYNDFWLQSSKITGSWHSPYGYYYLMYADVTE